MSVEAPRDADRPSPTSRPEDADDAERQDMAGVVGTPLGRAVRLIVLAAAVVLLGMTQGLSMLIVVAALVVMIFLHELGHYVMARRAGMLVTEFFIGFGPRIWSFRRGETEYGLKAIPAGAYVKIIGMSNMEEVDPALESRTYRQGSFGQRLGVAVAGSTMHFLIAIVLLVVQFAVIGDPLTDRWAVGAVTPGSAADDAGLVEGDEIVAFGGEEISSFDDFRAAIPGAEAGTTELTVVRDGETVAVPVELAKRAKIIGTIGEDIDVLDNGEGLVLGTPFDGGEAEEAGLDGGETLLAVNGTTVSTLEDLAPAASGVDGGEVVLSTVSADGGETEHRIDLGTAVDATDPGAFVGVGSRPVLEPVPLPSAAAGAASTFGQVAWASIEGVGRFLWPPNLIGFVVDAVGGEPEERNAVDEPTEAAGSPSTVSETRPISIVGVAILGSDLSSQNVANLVLFLAQLNIFIGIFNLFPLLPFDGGHVVIAVYEKAQELRRRSTRRYLADVSRMLPVAYGVIMVLVVVGLLAIFVDVTRGVSL